MLKRYDEIQFDNENIIENNGELKREIYVADEKEKMWKNAVIELVYYYRINKPEELENAVDSAEKLIKKYKDI